MARRSAIGAEIRAALAALVTTAYAQGTSSTLREVPGLSFDPDSGTWLAGHLDYVLEWTDLDFTTGRGRPSNYGPSQFVVLVMYRLRTGGTRDVQADLDLARDLQEDIVGALDGLVSSAGGGDAWEVVVDAAPAIATSITEAAVGLVEVRGRAHHKLGA